MDINVFKDKKIYFVTDNDLDGISCRILSEYYIIPIALEINYYCNNDRSLPELNFEIIKNSDIVIFTDIAPYSLELYNQIIDLKKEAYIFDHHITSRELLGSLSNYFFTIDKCATKILFEELTEKLRIKKSIQEYVELVNCYDLYHLTDKTWRSAKALNNIMFSYVNWRAYNYEDDNIRHLKFIDMQLKKFDISNNYFFTYTEKEKALKAEKKEHENFEQALKKIQFRTDNEGNKYAYTECSSKTSWVANLLLEKYKQLDYIAIRSTFNDKRGNIEPKISLRSKNYNVSIIAEKHGGGGHAQASGIDFRDNEIFTNFRLGKIHLI